MDIYKYISLLYTTVNIKKKKIEGKGNVLLLSKSKKSDGKPKKEITFSFSRDLSSLTHPRLFCLIFNTGRKQI